MKQLILASSFLFILGFSWTAQAQHVNNCYSIAGKGYFYTTLSGDLLITIGPFTVQENCNRASQKLETSLYIKSFK